MLTVWIVLTFFCLGGALGAGAAAWRYSAPHIKLVSRETAEDFDRKCIAIDSLTKQVAQLDSLVQGLNRRGVPVGTLPAYDQLDKRIERCEAFIDKNPRWNAIENHEARIGMLEGSYQTINRALFPHDSTPETVRIMNYATKLFSDQGGAIATMRRDVDLIDDRVAVIEDNGCGKGRES